MVPSVTAVDDSYSIEPGDNLVVSSPSAGVLANDGGSPLSVISVAGEYLPVDSDHLDLELPSGALVTMYADGTFTYIPGEGMSFSDSFDYGITDGNDTASATITVNVGNEPPVISGVSLDNTAPGANDTLTASVSATDPNYDSIQYTYVWYVNDVQAKKGDIQDYFVAIFQIEVRMSSSLATCGALAASQNRSARSKENRPNKNMDVPFVFPLGVPSGLGQTLSCLLEMGETAYARSCFKGQMAPRPQALAGVHLGLVRTRRQRARCAARGSDAAAGRLERADLYFERGDYVSIFQPRRGPSGNRR